MELIAGPTYHHSITLKFVKMQEGGAKAKVLRRQVIRKLWEKLKIWGILVRKHLHEGEVGQVALECSSYSERGGRGRRDNSQHFFTYW